MTVDEYIAQFEGDVRRRLISLRQLVKEVSPEAVESFSYGLVGYKLRGKPLVYFGGFKNHVGLYATPNGHEAFKKDFEKYKQSKGSVQFPHNKPLPFELVRKVILYRNDQI